MVFKLIMYIFTNFSTIIKSASASKIPSLNFYRIDDAPSGFEFSLLFSYLID